MPSNEKRPIRQAQSRERAELTTKEPKHDIPTFIRKGVPPLPGKNQLSFPGAESSNNDESLLQGLDAVTAGHHRHGIPSFLDESSLGSSILSRLDVKRRDSATAVGLHLQKPAQANSIVRQE